MSEAVQELPAVDATALGMPVVLTDAFEAVGDAPNGIPKLRELILDLAVRGKLVEQDPNDEPASELLKKIEAEKEKLVKEKKIKKPSLITAVHNEELPWKSPTGWSWVRLGHITARLGSGSTPRGGKNVYVSNGVPFLRSQNVWNSGLDLSDVAFIPDTIHEKMNNTHVRNVDILLNITGASLGRCALVPEDLRQANVSQHVSIVRPVLTDTRQFLHLCILSPYVQGLVWSRQVGMAREGLSKKVLEQFEIPIPPLAEQKRIVAKIDALMTLCDQLDTQLQASSGLSENLASAVAASLN